MNLLKEKLNLDKEIFILRFHWAAILAFVVFWSYGFFGALTSKSFGLVANIFISLILCGIFILFLWLWRKDDSYKDEIVIKNKDIFVFASFFLLMLILSFGNLTMPLNGDQLAHSQQSKLHSITLIDFLSNRIGFFNNVSYKWLIYIVDLLMIFTGFLFYKFTKNKSLLFKTIIFSSLFLFFRFAIVIFGGAAGPHPTFRLFPLWLSSAIFTSSDFSFRLAQFIGLIILMWFIQRSANKKFNFINSWLFALAVGTIPVLWHVGILAELSIWTAVLWTIFLLYGKNNYIRWISVISIFTLLRQSAFVALIPLFLIIIFDLVERREFDFKKIFILLIPILLMAPFLINSTAVGTPVSYQGDIPSYQRVWSALNPGMVSNAIMNSIGWPWIIFLFIFPFFIFKNPVQISAILIFFIAGVYIFYMIDSGVWGLGRYQAEYIVPFIIFGFFLFVNFINSRYDFARKFLPVIFIFLIIYNVYVFENLAEFNKPIDELKTIFNKDIKIRGNYMILSEFPYEYNKAFKTAKENGYAGKIFTAGATYGVFGEVLNGFSIADIKAEKNIYKQIQLDISAENINKNEDIQLVLISDLADGDKLKNDLENLGWKNWREFKNKEYGSTIFSLVRNET